MAVVGVGLRRSKLRGKEEEGVILAIFEKLVGV